MESKDKSIRNEEGVRLENETKQTQTQIAEVKKEEELEVDLVKPDAAKAKPKNDDIQKPKPK